MGRDEKYVFALWIFRERISVVFKYVGVVYKYDFLLLMVCMYNLVVVLCDCLCLMFGLWVKVFGYGYAGDGNLYLNVSCAEYDDVIECVIELFVYEYMCDEWGSVSVEYGLGVMKVEEIYYSKDVKVVEFMATMKRAFDSFGIMNLYKVLLVVVVGLSKL